MIEGFERWDPLNELEIFAVMFGVALRAIFFVRKPPVESAALRNPLGNFRVAFLALEHSRTGAKFVTGGALRRAAQRLVGFRKRAGRDLRSHRMQPNKQKGEEKSDPGRERCGGASVTTILRLRWSGAGR